MNYKRNIAIVVSNKYDCKTNNLREVITKVVTDAMAKDNLEAKDIRIMVPCIRTTDNFIKTYRDILERMGFFVWAVPYLASRPTEQRREIHSDADEVIAIMHKTAVCDEWIRDLLVVDPRTLDPKPITRYWIRRDNSLTIARSYSKKSFR